VDKFLISDLAGIIKAHEPQVTSGEQCSFTGLSIDSRTTKTGDCFFAICGENFDGHDYISGAFAKGAVCAVISKDILSGVVQDVCREKTNTQYAIRNTRYEILKVDDTVKALGDFALEYRRQCGFKVVAITGSVGKTTVRQILYHVLSQKYRAHQAPKNFNNNIGLPLTLLGADPQHQIVIAEMGTNHTGEIAYLTRIAQPDIAVVTNVFPAHLDGFGNLQTIVKEKLSILEGLSDDGILIINAGIESRPARPLARIVTFGKLDDSDYQARNITSDGFSSRFTIDSTEIYLPLAGPGNIENALAAWAVCSQLGLPIDDFAKGLKTLPAIPMRAELLQVGTLTVLNDCYNANPASMKNALDILSRLGLKENHRLVFICGEMAELGNQTEQIHAELGAAIADANVQLLIAVGKLAKITAQAAKENASCDLQIKCFEDTLSACNNLQEFIKDKDIILVKGSRVAKLEMAVEKLKELFS